MSDTYYEKASKNALTIIDDAIDKFSSDLEDLETTTVYTKFTLNTTLPLKYRMDDSKEISTIDEFLNDRSKTQIIDIIKDLKLAKTQLSNIMSDRENIRIKYEKHYCSMLKEVESAFNVSNKCSIKRATQYIWQQNDKIKIDEIEKFAMEALCRDLIKHGYNATVTSKHEYTPNTDDCRGCSDYTGWFELSVIF